QLAVRVQVAVHTETDLDFILVIAVFVVNVACAVGVRRFRYVAKRADRTEQLSGTIAADRLRSVA
ncbi:hypothetical protein BZM27_53780, partial [Paraburkholderia steynii]